MTGIEIDWSQLEQAFENHAPDVQSVLDRESGEILVVSKDVNEDDPDVLRVQARPERFLPIEPVPSREQYRMMEHFIETVPEGPLQDQLKDCIVGKGAFRRFKDAVGRYPEERKRWFAFRDVLLHQHILEWLKRHKVELSTPPDWSLELPEIASPEALVSPPPPPAATPEPPRQDALELKDYVQAWARAHGAEYQYLFGPAAFDRLAEDMSQEFNFFRRRG